MYRPVHLLVLLAAVLDHPAVGASTQAAAGWRSGLADEAGAGEVVGRHVEHLLSGGARPRRHGFTHWTQGCSLTKVGHTVRLENR